jgi:response regulator NasT
MADRIGRLHDGRDTAVEAARDALEGLRIIVAHRSEPVRQSLVAGVRVRHEVLCECGSVAEVLDTATRQRPDLIITGVEFHDGDGIDAVIRVSVERPIPAVVVAERRSMELVEKAMHDHVMAYLIEPIDPADLDAAIVVAQARFEQFRELAEEVDSLRQALEDRKVIERAKGAIMAHRQVAEAEAFGQLRSRAQNARVKIIEVARGILEHGPDFKADGQAQ